MRFRRVILAPVPLHPLSPMEYKCLTLYGEGLRYNDIMKVTGTTLSTVRNQLWHAHQKLGVKTSTEAFFKLQRMIRNGQL